MIRYIEAPTRRPGETGRAFVERMLAQLGTGGATALPIPKVEITAKVVRVDKALTVKPKPTGEVKKSTDVVLDFRGQPDLRPTTRKWPPPYDPVTMRSSHRYVGHWPPKWLTPRCTVRDIEAATKRFKAKEKAEAKAAEEAAKAKAAD